MSIRYMFEKQLRALRMEVLKMASDVEYAIEQAVFAFKEKDPELAKSIVRGDTMINAQEVNIEKKCMEIIARQQPLAADLRKVSATLKLVTDLERIGDQCADIAVIVLDIGQAPPVMPPQELYVMGEIAREMVNHAIQAFIKDDLDIAMAVCHRDDELDDTFDRVVQDIANRMRQDPASVDQSIKHLMIAKYFERIGDHATNVVEWVAFNVTGHITYLSKHFDVDADTKALEAASDAEEIEREPEFDKERNDVE